MVHRWCKKLDGLRLGDYTRAPDVQVRQVNTVLGWEATMERGLSHTKTNDHDWLTADWERHSRTTPLMCARSVAFPLLICNLCLGVIEHALVPLPALRCAPPRSTGAGRPYSRHPAAAVSYESSTSRGLSGHTTQTFSTAKEPDSI